MASKVKRVASFHVARICEDPVILIGDKLPPKPKVDHDEIEKLLGEVPQRQQFVQQLYGQVEFDAEATSRYNRRFSENDFHSHRTSPSKGHRTHYSNSLYCEPHLDTGSPWRRAITIHGVPKNSKRYGSGRHAKENGGKNGSATVLKKCRTAEGTLIEENRDEDSKTPSSEAISRTSEKEKLDAGNTSEDNNKDGGEDDGSGKESMLELRIKEDDETSQHEELETDEQKAEKIKRLSPVFTRDASYRHRKRSSGRRHKPPRIHSLQLNTENHDGEGFPDNGPGSPQQLTEITDLEEASRLDQHALQRIASECIRVKISKPSIEFSLVDDDDDDGDQSNITGISPKEKCGPRLSFQLGEGVTNLDERKGSEGRLKLPGKEKDVRTGEAHQKNWLRHHMEGKDEKHLLCLPFGNVNSSPNIDMP